VIDSKILAIDTDFYSEFFANFSYESILKALARFDLAAGKLP
jgi:hypothetical protein